MSTIIERWVIHRLWVGWGKRRGIPFTLHSRYCDRIFIPHILLSFYLSFYLFGHIFTLCLDSVSSNPRDRKSWHICFWDSLFDTKVKSLFEYFYVPLFQLQCRLKEWNQPSVYQRERRGGLGKTEHNQNNSLKYSSIVRRNHIDYHGDNQWWYHWDMIWLDWMKSSEETVRYKKKYECMR